MAIDRSYTNYNGKDGGSSRACGTYHAGVWVASAAQSETAHDNRQYARLPTLCEFGRRVRNCSSRTHLGVGHYVYSTGRGLCLPGRAHGRLYVWVSWLASGTLSRSDTHAAGL